MAKRRPAGDGMVRRREDGRWEGRMQKQACGIVGGFMEDIFGKELKPWQESEKPETER